MCSKASFRNEMQMQIWLELMQSFLSSMVFKTFYVSSLNQFHGLLGLIHAFKLHAHYFLPLILAQTLLAPNKTADPSCIEMMTHIIPTKPLDMRKGFNQEVF